jgi:hypothetical protein
MRPMRWPANSPRRSSSSTSLPHRRRYLHGVSFAHRRPCSLMLPRCFTPHPCGLHLLVPRPGLSVGTRLPWPTPSAPSPALRPQFLHQLVLIRSPTRAPLSTPRPIRVYFLLFVLPALHVPLPSWSPMALAFLSPPWALPVPTAPFVSLRFLWPPVWFTTFSLFAVSQLTTLARLSLTPPASPCGIWPPGVSGSVVTTLGHSTPFGFRRLFHLLRPPFPQPLSPLLLPPLLGTAASAILAGMP